MTTAYSPIFSLPFFSLPLLLKLSVRSLGALFTAFFLMLLIAPKSYSSDQISQASNDDNLEQGYISCSHITAENLTVLQLAQRGLTQAVALKELPFNHRKAKQRLAVVYKLVEEQGILNAYSIVNSNFARCAKLAHEVRGVPAKDMLEYGYYFCAGENKLRYETILRINDGFNLDKVLAETPDSHFDVAISYFKLIEQKGILASFDYTANNFKACLKRIL